MKRRLAGFFVTAAVIMSFAIVGCGTTSSSSSSGSPALAEWNSVGGQVDSSSAEGEDPVMILSTPMVSYRHASYVLGLNRWSGTSWALPQPDPSNGNYETFAGPPNACDDGGTLYVTFAHSGDSNSTTDTFYDRVLAYTWNTNGGWQQINGGNEVSYAWAGNQWDAYEPTIACRPSQDPVIAWVEGEDAIVGDNAYVAVVGSEASTRSGPINRNLDNGGYVTDARVVGVTADDTYAYVAQWESDPDDQSETDLFVTQLSLSQFLQTNLSDAPLDQDYNNNNLCAPAMVLYDGDLVVAYSAHRPRPGGTDNTRDIYIKRWNGTGWSDMGTQPLSAYTAVEHQYSNNPSFALAGDTLYLAWEEDGGTYGSNIFVARWDDAGSAWVLDDDNTRIAADIATHTLDPSLAYDADDGYLYVACEAMISGHSQIYVKRRKL